METTRSAPPTTVGSDDGKKKERDGWGLSQKVLAFLTALLTLATAAVGLWGRQTASERDDLQEQSNSLSAELDASVGERDQLVDDLQEARQQIEDLESAATSTTSPTVSSDLPLPGDTAFLADLDPVVDRSWDVERDLNIDGTLYTNGLESARLGYCGSNGVGTDQEIEYSIGRQHETFHAVVGLSEASSPGLPVKVEVFGDERSLWTDTIVVGTPRTIDLDVTDVLRLRVVATKQFEDPGGCQPVYAALGDPQLS